MNVLGSLASRAGEAVTHEELLQAYWRGAVSSTNAIHKCIAELRHAFGNGGGEQVYIETVTKRGYRLLAPVQRPGAPAGEPATPTAQDPAPFVSAATGAIANPPRSARKAWMLGIGLMGACIALAGLAWWVFRDVSRDLQVVTIGAHSAALLPAEYRASAGTAIRLHELVADQIIARLESDATVSRREIDAGTYAVDARQLAGQLGVDYVVVTDFRESGDRLQASLSILPATAARLSHVERFEFAAADEPALVNAVSTHAIRDLGVLLNPADTGRMHAWHTRNVHAYRDAREGDAYQRNSNVESLVRAERLYQQAIEADPGFAYAYDALASVYHILALVAADTPERDRVRRALQDLLRDASVRLQDPETIAGIETRYRYLSVASAFDAEALWHGEIEKNPQSVEGLRRYAELLRGAKLLDESERYLDRAIELAPPEDHANLRMDYSTLADARGDHEESIRLLKYNVDLYRDFTVSLYGLVRIMARLGRYAEAEAYLQRLNGTDPAWGYVGELTLRALRGDIPPGSPAQIEAFASPYANNANRGITCFMLGDVDCGVRYWREIEPAFLPLQWHFNSGQELFWAPGVVEDPRYQALLDELGIGGRWRALMRNKAAGLAQFTGIEVTTPPPSEDLVL